MEPVHDVMPVARGAKPYRLLVGAAAVALTVTGFIAIPHIHPIPSPIDVLAEARDFVSAHPTARYTGEITETYKDTFDDESAPGPVDNDDLGSTVTFKGKVLGEIQSAARYREIRNGGRDGVEETVLIGTTVYSRYADSVAGLASEKFVPYEMEGEEVDNSDFDALAVLKAARSPETISREGDVTTISADIDPVVAMGKTMAKGVNSFTAKFAVLDGGELQTMQLRIRGDEGSADMDLAFKDWGALVQVAEPRADQIDPTPGIAEEAIAVWDHAPLYQPKNIPDGWEIDYADVLSKEDTPEGCEQVEIDIDPIDIDFDETEEPPYLVLYQLPTSCAQDFGGVGVVPFRAGRYAGFVQTDGDGYSMMQMSIDDKTTLQADSNLPVADLAKIVAELVPLDLTKTPGAIVGIGVKQITT